MIITFCGHSNYTFDDGVRKKLKELLLLQVRKNPSCKFYLGGYGNFDTLCLRLLQEIKIDFPTIELIFITPYLDKNYSKLENAKKRYDSILYPPIENIPKRFCIAKRNEWMVNEADLVIAFVQYSWGGAAKTLDYAKRKKVPFYNLAKAT